MSDALGTVAGIFELQKTHAQRESQRRCYGRSGSPDKTHVINRCVRASVHPRFRAYNFENFIEKIALKNSEIIYLLEERMREKFHWDVEKERQEFHRRMAYSIRHWKSQLPNLRVIFRDEEIDDLLSESVSYCGQQNDCRGERFIEFVIRTGYKDEPKVDKGGKPLLRRTTAVHRAGSRYIYSKDDTLRELFKIYNRFDINYIDEKSGRSHFHVACRAGFEDIVEKFLELGQDPDCICLETGDSPLYIAVSRYHKEMTELLLRNGADPNLINMYGMTSLHKICMTRNGDDELAKMLFEISDEKYQILQLDAKDTYGRTPLQWALLAGNKKVAELLLRNGADPNLADPKGLTPMHIMCQKFYLGDFSEQFFKINHEKNHLLKVNTVDNLGRTPLHYAVTYLLLNTVGMVLDQGADISSFDFPTESHFDECFEVWREDDNFKLKLISGALGIVERLEKKGYEMKRSDALTLMTVFAKHGIFEKSVDFDEYCYDVEESMIGAGYIMMKSSLSLYDLIQLRPNEAATMLTYSDYYEFACSEKLYELPQGSIQTCVLRLFYIRF
ncbi:unnamed protein product [Trichogramma brassicae]|uniref:Uncharacterized protein n=1 Tax=Trichogramma brassicae TaxID=86971 RepID=A0A6H5HZW3_9HYME|nr:unnamed protein product [Trichogramma brassicae]